MLIGVPFALEQIAHERKVIEAFAHDPQNENVASVTLKVSGVEYIILIHDEDFRSLAMTLLKMNKRERVRIEGMGIMQSATFSRGVTYTVGLICGALSFIRVMISALGILLGMPNVGFTRKGMSI